MNLKMKMKMKMYNLDYFLIYLSNNLLFLLFTIMYLYLNNRDKYIYEILFLLRKNLCLYKVINF